ncbi:hypothetical protein DCS_03140 [Drechmeria coniospora]|uniref:Uncharacterized protein n=1 Tax=Drechmeria coniospora TaxID=98403 RepID=A0A151GY25_DRECN|nr:hypothetical protein DCS_03140 [Drechmeria coniospora]KYK61995.1 hypothetical protein DCS_03140 [Drechmeria coniospora]
MDAEQEWVRSRVQNVLVDPNAAHGRNTSHARRRVVPFLSSRSAVMRKTAEAVHIHTADDQLEHGHACAPSTATTSALSTATTGAPSTATTSAPSTATTGAPSTATTGAPSTATTSAPSTATTGAPSTATTGAPSTATVVASPPRYELPIHRHPSFPLRQPFQPCDENGGLTAASIHGA